VVRGAEPVPAPPLTWLPNLVNSVKGLCAAGKGTWLLGGHQCAGQGRQPSRRTPDLVNDPGAFAKFQAAQGELSSGPVETSGGDRELSAA